MYLLDTDILIDSLRGHKGVLAQLVLHRGDPMAMSVISLMEMYYGARKSKKPEINLTRVRTIERGLAVIPLGPETSETFGTLKAGLEEQGQRLEDFDLAIAATALAHNLVLATGNEKHFSRIDGLRVENWTQPI